VRLVDRSQPITGLICFGWQLPDNFISPRRSCERSVHELDYLFGLNFATLIPRS
jgi:hypothetical protein